jgi:hypothetical protein
MYSLLQLTAAYAPTTDAELTTFYDVRESITDTVWSSMDDIEQNRLKTALQETDHHTRFTYARFMAGVTDILSSDTHDKIQFIFERDVYDEVKSLVVKQTACAV